MTKQSKLVLFFLSLLIGVLAVSFALAQESKINLYFFYGSTCLHCQKAEPFLEDLKNKYPNLEIISHEVFGNQENARLLQEFLARAGEETTVRVPAFFVGDRVIIGFRDEQSTGQEIEEAILASPGQKPKTFNLPLLGEFNPKKISLPILAVVIGLMDGFNPCAMWVLLLLISLLLTVKSRKQMWLVGLTFILVSGIVYFLFMTAWLNLFLFLGYVRLIQVVIGGVAIGAGFWRLRDFLTWQPGVCKVTDEKSHSKMEQKIRQLLAPSALPATFLGVVGLAFSVNLVEFFCSAGFPAIFSQVLSIQNVDQIWRYVFLLIYVFFYLLDDLLVFSLAMITLKKTGFTDKYSRYSTLIGGLLLLLLGLGLVFRPELLMFGA
jgi:thiol-disulfide isomerase/thioredoxin